MRAVNEIRPPAVGEVAPDFTVLDATGVSRRLADLCAERPLVLVFYRGHW
jgi:peroxiredoxin